ncbi:MAG TPA: hypothetical protein VGF17_12695 [Phytomonospora sp.]
MTVPQQADADPVEVVLDWLRGDPEVLDLLGGPEHLSGIPEAPWPHLVVGDGTAGDLRDFRWDAELEVTLNLYGAPDGAPGASAIRRLLYRIAARAAALADEQAVEVTTPVVSRVKPSGRDIAQALSNGQPLLSLGVLVTIRPPLQLAP